MAPLDPIRDAPAPSEAVLTAFSELLERRSTVVVVTENDIEAEGLVSALEPSRGRVVLEIPEAPMRGLDADDEVDLCFILGGRRWIARTLVHHHFQDHSRFALILPSAVEAADRRREPRILLEPSERVWASLTPGEPGHLQLRGRLANLSEGGCRVSVEEAVDTRTGAPLDTSTLSLAQGQVVDLLEIQGLRMASFETQARVMDSTPGALGPVLGLRFKFLSGEDRSFLQSFVAERALRPAGAPAPPPPLRTEEPEAPRADRHSSLVRLKKRLRTILLAMPPGPQRDKVEAFLRQEGYAHLILATSLDHVTEAFRGGPVHLAYVDGGVSEMTALELATFLYFVRHDQACPVVLVEPGLARPPQGVDRLLASREPGPELGEILEDLLGLRRPDAPPEPPAPADPRLKRFKTLALVMPPGKPRDELQGFLVREGFTRVHPAGTVMELARLLRNATPDLCFIDWPGPGALELDILHLLTSLRFAEPPRLAMAQDQVTSQMAREATRLGVARMLLKPYPLDAALVDSLLQLMTE